MADEKKVVTLMNQSKRHFDTVNADGKAVRHAPGRTEEYTLEQAKQFDPRELVDLSKLPGSVDKEALRKENAGLKSENEALKAQIAALTPKDEPKLSEEEPTQEGGAGRRKK